MSIFRTYRMTVASTWYDKQKKAAQEYEMHFKIARKGDIARVRSQLTWSRLAGTCMCLHTFSDRANRGQTREDTRKEGNCFYSETYF